MHGGILIRVRTCGPRLRLSLASRMQVLEPARRAVLDFLAPHDLEARSIYGIELVLEETLANAIAHGFSDGCEHTIELSVEVEPRQVMLQFEDDGIEFDPAQRQAADPPKSFEDASLGGRGLMLVSKFAKTIRYQRIDGRNRLTICVES